jgi:hypothetical protein
VRCPYCGHVRGRWNAWCACPCHRAGRIW